MAKIILIISLIGFFVSCVSNKNNFLIESDSWGITIFYEVISRQETIVSPVDGRISTFGYGKDSLTVTFLLEHGNDYSKRIHYDIAMIDSTIYHRKEISEGDTIGFAKKIPNSQLYHYVISIRERGEKGKVRDHFDRRNYKVLKDRVPQNPPPHNPAPHHEKVN